MILLLSIYNCNKNDFNEFFVDTCQIFTYWLQKFQHGVSMGLQERWCSSVHGIIACSTAHLDAHSADLGACVDVQDSLIQQQVIDACIK